MSQRTTGPSLHSGRGPRPPDTGPVPRVSPTSAQRFASRVRARRRRRVGAALGVATVLALAGWALLGSSWLAVQRIQVTGTQRLDPAAVREAASGELGEPLLLAGTDDVTRRVAALDLVQDVRVERAWPRSLRVVVTERTPVVAVRQQGTLALLDADGVEVARQAKAPAGVPVVDLTLSGPQVAETVRTVVTVSASLPAPLRAQVARTVAAGPDRIELRMRNGAQVVWGSGERSADKAAVLQALLKQKAKVYDVSAPDAPAVRGR